MMGNGHENDPSVGRVEGWSMRHEVFESLWYVIGRTKDFDKGDWGEWGKIGRGCWFVRW